MMGIASITRSNLTLVWTLKFGLHVIMLFSALILAYQLRRALPLEWWTDNPDGIRVIGWACLYALTGGVVELIFQGERSAWRFASMREAIGIVRSVTITSGLFLGLVFFVDRGVQLPRSVLPLTWLVSVALLVGCRILWRLPHDPGLVADMLPSWWPRPATSRMPMLIVGPMADADRQLRVLQGDPDTLYQPVGVITTNAEEVGLRLHGVPFIADLSTWNRARTDLGGGRAIPHAILFLADPIRAFGLSTERIGELRRAGHRLLKPQIMGEIDGGPKPANRLEEIPLEDFLPRKPIALDPAPIGELVAGRRVLVTGAGGSIGSEICRQLVFLGCSHLSMVDHSESLLFEIERELTRDRGHACCHAILANVRDANRIADIVRDERPDIIFHAAALKHVSLVEQNCAEGALTNVLGTWNVISAATANGVGQFVLISTDKAAAPTSVMGATKRLAEGLLHVAPRGPTKLAAVRFGNVLGSAGSVVPIFRDQIMRGGPVTVTHPDVNRFFMTIPEAVQLVLHSSAIRMTDSNPHPRKFLLEMGDPVRIVDLARQMIELSGKIPDIDITIDFTGLKAGEKLSEMLSDEGERVISCIDGIMEVSTDDSAQIIQMSQLTELFDTAASGNNDQVKKLVFDLLSKTACYGFSDSAEWDDNLGPRRHPAEGRIRTGDTRIP